MERSGLAEVEWSVEPARSGEPTLKIGGRQVHSGYSPHREAERIADGIASEMRERGSELLIALGSGLGLVYEALVRRTETPILLWEPFPKLAAACGAMNGWQEHVTLVESPDEYDAALERFSPQARRPHFFVHAGYEHPARFEARYLARGMRALQRRDPTHARRGSIPSRRSLDFLVRFPFIQLAERLRSRVEGQTVVVASGGPSLQLAVDALAARRGGVVFAALQAVRPLLEAGVSVDAGVIADPKDYSEFVDGLEDPYRLLLADSSSHPRILDRDPDRVHVYHLETPHLHESVWVSDGLIVDSPTATVSEVSTWLAHALGAREIVLAGVDFASNDERYGVRFRVPGVDGAATWTNEAYFHGARCMDWLCPRIARTCPVYRLGDGLPLRGTEAIDATGLAEKLAGAPRFDPPDPEKVFDADRWERADALLGRTAGAAHKAIAGPSRAGDSPIPDFHPLSGANLRRACADARQELEKRRSAV